MRFVIDLDGVVFDFDRGWIERYNREFGTDIGINQDQRYNELHLLVGLAAPIDFWDWFRYTTGFLDLPLYDGAEEALERQGKLGHVTLATSRPKWARMQTNRAVRGLHHDDLAFIAQKEMLLADVYVDDNPEQLEKLYRMRSRAEVWRIRRPWNEQLEQFENNADSLLAVVQNFRQGGSPSVLSAHGETPPLSEHPNPTTEAERIIKAEKERTKNER